MKTDKFRWKVKRSDLNLKVVNFIQKKIQKPLSLRAIKKQIEYGYLHVNSRIEKFASKRVELDDVIEFEFKPVKIKKQKYILEKNDILYHNNDIIAVNKPAGYISTGCKNTVSIESIVSAYLSEQYDYHVCIPVHRLDKDTSGVLLFAKSQNMAKVLINQFKRKTVEKTYYAITYPTPKEKKGTISTFIGKLANNSYTPKWGNVSPLKGKKAITSYEVINQNNKFSLIKLYLHTGRTHQLRIHLQKLGTPIIGDMLYGSNQKLKIVAPRLMLHAKKINLQDQSKKEILVEAEFSMDFKSMLEQLKLY